MKQYNLDNVVEEALDSLRDVPPPDSTRQAATRQQFLASARRWRQQATVTEGRATHHSVWQRLLLELGIGVNGMWVKRLIAVEIGAAAALMIAIGAVLLLRQSAVGPDSVVSESQEGVAPSEDVAPIAPADAETVPSAPLEESPPSSPEQPSEEAPVAEVSQPEGDAGEVVIDAPAPSDSIAATLVVPEGQANVQSGVGEAVVAAGQALQVQAGDTITLDEVSEAELTLADGSTVQIAGGTTVALVELHTDEGGPYRVHLELVAGRTVSRVQQLLGVDDMYRVSTPSSTASVRGTVFSAEVLGPESSYFNTTEGVVAVTLDEQEVEVPVGQAVEAMVGQELKVHPHGYDLAQQLTDELGEDVSYEDVIASFEAGFGFGQIKKVYILSEELGVEPARVFELLDEGMGLGQIKKAADLHATYGISLDDILAKVDSGMSLTDIEKELSGKPTGADKDKDKKEKDEKAKDAKDKDDKDKPDDADDIDPEDDDGDEQ